MKKKVAFIDLSNFNDWPAGGMLQYELAIIPYLAEEFDLDIWGVSVDGIVNPTLKIDETLYPINIWGNVKTKSKIIPNYWRGLELLLKRNFFNKYDVIYAHSGSCLVALSGNRKNKCKLVYHQHGLSHLHDYGLMSLIQRPFVNKAQFISDLVFVVSDKKSVEDYYQTIKTKTRGKFISIGSPLDLSLFPQRRMKKYGDTIRLIYTGRIDYHKDVCTLIDALHQLDTIYPNFYLTIIGDGNERKNVEKRIQEYNLKNKVEIKGVQPRKEVLNNLLQADIYITASIGEGSSISVLEAYASGLPVVCFDVPGLSKQVVDEITGRVVGERNPRKLAMAIIEVKNNIIQYSDNTLKEVQKYEAKAISTVIINEIRSLL